MNDKINNAIASKAWPFEEAALLLKRFEKAPPAKGYALFSTGYGPSGLPHIGTFGEVARTTMVRRAFQAISDIPTKLFAFSDDMDGLRKVPDNIPNKEMVAGHLGKPLTSIPDPFGTHESYGAHMNSRLRAFLDQFGFEYEFKSATECYKVGLFDKALLRMLEVYDEVINVILPTLGEVRQETYSPFLPVCRKTGKVLQVAVIKTNLNKGTITYKDEDGEEVETVVTGGNCKLQWKADWAMRWYALGVDYEMYGKDLIPSAELSSKICKILGGTPPNGFNYELFLDENGQKISKSKGNGIGMDDWLRYATPESLSYYMYQTPKRAKKLYFDVIPKCVDEYLTFIGKFKEQNEIEKFANPVWHIHNGKPPEINIPISFSLLLNLVGASNSEDSSILWGFISRYIPGLNKENNPELDKLVQYAVSYYHDFIKPSKKFRAATELEEKAIRDLALKLKEVPKTSTSEEIQNLVYSIGKEHGFNDLKLWFQALYEVLLGQSQGPRIGSFILLYGIMETVGLIEQQLKKKAA